jgi:hypothetical protein
VNPRTPEPAARTKPKRTPSKKRKGGRFENLVARYYRGVCTFASRLTDDPVEAVLLTHAAFTSTRKLLRTRDEVRLVTILLTTVMAGRAGGKTMRSEYVRHGARYVQRPADVGPGTGS